MVIYEENDDEISMEEIFDPVVEKPSRSAIESALDALQNAAMFSDEGVQLKDWFLILNGYMKTRDWNALSKEILQIFFTPV